LPFTRTGSANS